MTIHARLALIVTLIVVPSFAHAGPKQQAKGHVAKATKAHQAGKFDVALVELQAAYKLDPEPELLFAIAQVYVKLGNCPLAIPFYEKFLAATKDPDAKPVVTQAIEACAPPPVVKVEPEPRPEPKPEPIPEPRPEPKPEPKPAPVIKTERPFEPGRAEITARPRPWYKDRLGDALVIGGAIATVAGVVMYTAARADLDTAESAPTLVRYNELVDDAHSKRTISLVLVGGGAAFVGAGVIRYLLRDNGTSSRSRGVGMVPATGGGLVTWTGRF